MAEQELDRSEQATPYKLQKAKERGQVSKSVDVVSAVVLAFAVVFLSWKGWETLVAQFRFDQVLLIQAGRIDPHGAVLWPLIAEMLRATFYLLIPFFLALVLSAVIGNLVQVSLNFSTEPLKPDIERINPVNTLKRLFSFRTLFDGARACFKVALLMLVAYYVLKDLSSQFYIFAELSPVGFLRLMLNDLSAFCLKMVLALGVIAVLDFIYTRREFAKKMRMGRRELKEEIKHREGDPRIRARMRELRREMLKRSMSLRRTGEADVLLTNPTHFAVALRYEHGKMESPQLVAKGTGMLAGAMRKIAALRRIPVIQNPSLARRIFHEMEIDAHVPPTLYAEVARIIVWVFAMRERRQQNLSGEPV